VVTLDQVRTQIGDRAQIWPSNAEPPELLGTGDGTRTIFTLRYENYIPGTLVVFEAEPPTSGSGDLPEWTAVSTTPPVAVGTTSETAVITPGAATITPESMENIAEGAALLCDVAPNQEVVIVTGVTLSTFTAIFAMAHEVGFAIAGAPPYIVGTPNPNADGTQANNATVTLSIAAAEGLLIGAQYQATDRPAGSVICAEAPARAVTSVRRRRAASGAIAVLGS
jgi:hypothetical protein